jgi:hypothetical protein
VGCHSPGDGPGTSLTDWAESVPAMIVRLREVILGKGNVTTIQGA